MSEGRHDEGPEERIRRECEEKIRRAQEDLRRAEEEVRRAQSARRPRETAGEIRAKLRAVSEMVPSLLRHLRDTLYSTEAAGQVGQAIGAFYKSLLDSGVPEGLAASMTSEYMKETRGLSRGHGVHLSLDDEEEDDDDDDEDDDDEEDEAAEEEAEELRERISDLKEELRDLEEELRDLEKKEKS